jgi:DNA-binding winged helix-turn-helix (wHTH) protein/tetratricopeptide (TPR) repeat protein
MKSRRREADIMTVYRFGPFRLEKESLLLCLDGAPLGLGPKVVETLLALLEHPGEVLSKSELLDRIWPEGFVEEANLAQNIYVLRKVLRVHWQGDPIETVPRRGYRFIGEVTVEQAQPMHVAEPGRIRLPGARRVGALAVMAAMLAVGAGAGMLHVAARTHSDSAVSRGLSRGGARMYAMGKFYWNQRTAGSIAKSIRYFENVTKSDPADARGYAGLAGAYAIDADYEFGGLSKKAALSRAASYARTALQMDRNSADAHAVLGLVFVESGDMKRGFAEYRRALALNPTHAAAHQWYGAALLLSGKIPAAYRELQEATNLDPESVAASDWLSQAAFIARRYNDALAYGRQTLDLSPQRYGAYETIGLAYEALGNYRAAVAAYRMYGQTCTKCRYDADALLARVYALTHDEAHASYFMGQAEQGLAARQIDPDNFVAALIAMGRTNQALDMLRSRKHYGSAPLLAADPRMDPVRGDSRFRPYMQGPG